MNRDFLKQFLSGLMADEIDYANGQPAWWRDVAGVRFSGQPVLETEWLAVCHKAELRLGRGGMVSDYDRFSNALARICTRESDEPQSAPWPLRAEALLMISDLTRIFPK